MIICCYLCQQLHFIFVGVIVIWRGSSLGIWKLTIVTRIHRKVSDMGTENSKDLTFIGLITLIYLLLFYWGLSLVSPEDNISLMWLPGGFLLGTLVIIPRHAWATLITAVAITSMTFQLAATDRSIEAIALFTATNLIEAIVGAFFYIRYCGGREGLKAFSHLTFFLLICVFTIPSITSLLGAYAASELIGSTGYIQAYKAWFSSTGLGILFTAPLTVHLWLALNDTSGKVRKNGKLLLLCNLSIVLIVLIVLLASNHTLSEGSSTPVIVYLSLPILCWSAIKFGLLGVTTTSGVFALTAIQMTALGVGPFSDSITSPVDAVFQLHNYLAATIIFALYVAMAIDKLSRLTKKHRSMASHYQTLFDNSPISLWEEDFSAVKQYLDQQQEHGVEDIATWLKEDQSRVVQCAQLVKINNINYRTVEMFRADSTDSLLSKLDQIFNLDSLDAFREELITLYKGETHFRTEASQRRLDGELFYTHTAVNLVPGFERDWSRVVVSVEDITERKQIESQLQQAAAVFSNTAEGILIMDLNGNLTQVNEAFCDITGYSREQIKGINIAALKFDGRDSEPFDSIWETLTETGYWRGEFWGVRQDGIMFPELITFNSVCDEDGRTINYIGVFSDISHIKESEEKLDFLAHHDPLTGLPNRLLFHDRLQQSIKTAKRYGNKLAVIFLDIDRFKLINDSLGHAAGDDLLILVAKRLTKILRANDTVARLSGDEFTLIIEDIEMSNIERVMDKVISVFIDDFALKESTISACASAGVAVYPDDGVDHESLLKNADAAMFDAKESGRNTYHFYTAELTDRAMRAVKIEGALQSAIADNELYLVYQPQIDLVTNKCVGVEALIRWQHPELGLVSPELFIPIAERSGLIREVGEWVFREACRQGVEWQNDGIHIGRVAVNVSGYQLQSGDLPEVVEQVLKDTKFSPDSLEIEVTESFVMKRLDLSIAQLSRLKALGVEISIDDFGTGYSSLSYLKKLPIDKLKIDQSFIAGIPTDSNDTAITNSIISMARDLELTTIAEGVETIEQANFLFLKGCQQVQGYYFSKPVLPVDIKGKLTELKKVS